MKEIVNRKAKFEFHFLSEYEAGIVLTGTEVKSIKLGNANLTDAYCLFDNHGNLILKSLFIAEYELGNVHNHETRRDRRLLLRKTELSKLQKRVTEKGMTIVPYKIYFSERGLIKVQVILAQGKKSFDKRETIKERDNKRDLQRIKKLNN
ncbi:MAG TPA: SsrA-binding protein SmpB [Saprospiraceae bacterium]|nr:SsrA-binding protein SmpB [Saprospiraceae bacterium]HPK09588.1 SsrA-binding protein SmpB [Saprospiraceae bacterium]HRX29742.1 SsrA-binding protein SmpB [Saprospiraceae bacterium]